MAQDRSASAEELPLGMRTRARPLSPAEQSALSHARGNKEPYGRRWSKRKLEWTVFNAETQDDANVRVTLTYRPEGVFRGRPGEEVITVAPSGEIVEREQVHSPQTAFPWVLVAIAAVAVIAAAVLVPIMLLQKDAIGDPLYVSGRFLWMRVTEPVVVDRIHYTVAFDQNQVTHWEIARENQNTELAIIDVTLINQLTNQVLVAIDGDAAELVTTTGTTLKPLVATERAEPIEKTDSRYFVPGFVPLGRTVTITNGEQLRGMMVFEVPAGSDFREFRWRASDTLTARYS